MDLDELRKLAAKEELSLNYIAKDEMISKLLYDLQGFDDIILKGGTAINRVYLKNKRFSEDIDLDLVFKGNVKEAIARTKEIIGKIRGFDIARPRIMHETIRYDLYYINPLNHKDRIMLEFRAVKKALGYSKKIINFGFVPHEAALLNVYDIEKVIKHKIDCVMDRLEGKDFFDLYYLIELPHKKARISKEEIIKRISLEGKEIKAVANIINHYIPRSRRPSWSMFLEELKEKIRRY
ncbi:MAG: nucleotidyl transferase AbiEii/AbiGii toxin family protein [Candidatus Woesearchaeota archaeon]